MLQIDRLSLHVRAAAAPERAERLARRLRDAAVKGMERGRYALPGSYSHIFVERLAFSCAVSSEWDDEAIGATVARALAAALEHSVEQPQTVAFRDRVELLSAFYAALAEGRAWQRWWFDEFDGLRPLAASSALRTSVINEDARGLAALARLTESSFSNVIGLLSAGDAARLLAWLKTRRVAARADILSLWRRSASLASGTDDPTPVLDALIALERETPGAAGGEALRVLHAMAALRAAAARAELEAAALLAASSLDALRAATAKLSLPADWLDRLGESDGALIAGELVSIAEEKISSARQAAGEEAAHASAQERFFTPRGGELVSIAEEKTFSARQAAGEQAAHVPARERYFTPRGGAFVLLKALDWLGWPALWARSAGDELARAVAWAVTVRALAPLGACAGLSDAALRAAFAIERPIDFVRGRRREARAMLQRRTITGAAAALLEEFSKRIPGLAGASAGYLRRNVLALPASVERRGDACLVRLGRAPLDVLLVLAGAKTGRIVLPGGFALDLRVESAA